LCFVKGGCCTRQSHMHHSRLHRVNTLLAHQTPLGKGGRGSWAHWIGLQRDSEQAGWLAGWRAGFRAGAWLPREGGGGGGAGGGRALGAGTCGWVTVGGSLLGTENASTSWQDIARQNQSETANTNHPGCAVHRDWHWPAPPQLAAEMMLICMGQPRFLFRPDLHVGWCLCVCVQCLSMVWPAEACSSTCARSASPHLRGMRGLCSQ